MRDELRWQTRVWHWRLEDGKDRLSLFVAHHLPRRLVYWCAIRLGAEATTGRYGSTDVPSLTFTEAIRRWENVGG